MKAWFRSWFATFGITAQMAFRNLFASKLKTFTTRMLFDLICPAVFFGWFRQVGDYRAKR